MNTPEKLRVKAGLSMTQLADRAGVSKTTVSNLERGETVRLRGVTLEKIGKALRDRMAERNQKLTIDEFIDAVFALRDAKLRGKAA